MPLVNTVVIAHAQKVCKRKQEEMNSKEPIVQIPSPVETELACMLDNSSQEN